MLSSGGLVSASVCWAGFVVVVFSSWIKSTPYFYLASSVALAKCPCPCQEPRWCWLCVRLAQWIPLELQVCVCTVCASASKFSLCVGSRVCVCMHMRDRSWYKSPSLIPLYFISWGRVSPWTWKLTDCFLACPRTYCPCLPRANTLGGLHTHPVLLCDRWGSVL